jgi:peptidoglycan/LPS O-acetylase OafA/YrhL
VIDELRLRRWIGWAVLVVVLALAGWLVPRFLPRSPVTILFVCGLAVLTMKLVEHRVRRWLRRYAERRPPGP